MSLREISLQSEYRSDGANLVERLLYTVSEKRYKIPIILTTRIDEVIHDELARN